MATLGKRKRECIVIRKEEPVANPEYDRSTHQDLFKEYFESRFQPLPEEQLESGQVSREDSVDKNDDSSSEESDWEGLSDDGPTSPMIQIVDHGSLAYTQTSDNSSVEQKSFMVSAINHRHFAEADVKEECQTPKRGQGKLRPPRKAAH
jgi:hypothetical protein